MKMLEPSVTDDKRTFGLALSGVDLFDSPPCIQGGMPDKAKVRLDVFLWATYGLALFFLAGAGFGELYLDKPTFGANAWRDYFTLVAWGFGAEATRASVAQM